MSGRCWGTGNRLIIDIIHIRYIVDRDSHSMPHDLTNVDVGVVIWEDILMSHMFRILPHEDIQTQICSISSVRQTLIIW